MTLQSGRGSVLLIAPLPIPPDIPQLDSFKLGKAIPPALSNAAPRPGHRHQRSHSRNTSISSSTSLGHTLSSSRSSGLQESSRFSFGSLSSPSSNSTLSSSGSASSLASAGPAPPAGPPSKRNSHHRRLSSVSTRRESAELMGVSLPDLPAPSFEDNVNFGEKDSIRRRALWALEGKPDLSFNKVEIPELTTPVVEKMMFDFCRSSPYHLFVFFLTPVASAIKAASSGGSFGNSLMGNKRDSFKLLPSSSSSKDQLGTLLEEEEEEDEECVAVKPPQESLPSPAASTEDLHAELPTNTAAPLAKSAPRPRPATLNLRPLSLTPENIGSVTCQGLPTPSLTPSPRTGLRSLSLTSSPAAEESATTVFGHSIGPTGATRRPTLTLSMDSADSSSSQEERKSGRKSSISYKPSTTNWMGLPTPEATPTFNRRSSTTESARSSKSGDDEFFPTNGSYRPLSVSEQHFLFKSHNALLARITDLEKALSSRRKSMGGHSITGDSRPSSILSDASFPTEAEGSLSSEPTDEMLALVRDLKSERDELKKDVEGGRTRVADLDKQLVLVAKRVETERREAWVARSRVTLLEAEKQALDKRLEALDQAVSGLEAEKKDLEEQNEVLRVQAEERAKRIEELERELQRVKEELDAERGRKGEDSMATPKPRTFDVEDRWRQGLGLSSTARGNLSIDEEDRMFNFGFPMRAVQESAEERSDDEDELAGYEEDESDPELETSCLGSPHNDTTSSANAPPPNSSNPASDAFKIAPAGAEPLAATSHNHTHQSRHSLSRIWTFPKAAPVQSRGKKSHTHSNSRDKFFGCLDESDTSDDSGPITPMPLNYEESKGLFANALKYANDDDSLFVLPDGVGIVVEDPPVSQLKAPVVVEAVDNEDRLSDVEEDEDMFGEIGGIRIICTPPDDVEEEKEVPQIVLASPMRPVSKPPTLPALDFGRDDDTATDNGIGSFIFGQQTTTVPDSAPRPAPATAAPPTLPRGLPSRSSAGSGIPRPASRGAARPAQTAGNSTPSSKRAILPSFIPQPVGSPPRTSPLSVRPKTSIPEPTCIRQQSRSKPSSPPTPINTSKPSTSRIDNGSPSKPMNLRTFN